MMGKKLDDGIGLMIEGVQWVDTEKKGQRKKGIGHRVVDID